MRTLIHRAAQAAVLPLAVAGCATTAVDAQWRNTELPPSYLRGATVLVSCETREAVLQRICEDRVSAELSAHGATPVFAAPGTVAAIQPGVADAHYLPAARDSGAKAVLSMTIGASSAAVSQGVTLSIGGFGFGRSSAGGVGVSAPIGGGQVSNGYSANGRVTDVASGRLMWTARASAPPSGDVNAQFADLSKAVLDAAGKAGLF
ncbi:MAG: hypothetical protein ABI702_25350 [Burkholderiales bacterium]